MTFRALRSSRVYIRRLLSEKNKAVAVVEKENNEKTQRNLEDYQEVLNELELQRALEEAKTGGIIKRPENTEIALIDTQLPAFYSPETTFRIMGSKKYDEKIKRRVILRKLLKWTIPSISLLSSPLWIEKYFCLVNELLGRSILGSLVLENVAAAHFQLVAGAVLSAPFLAFLIKSSVDFPRYLISGIYVTADRSLSIKCYHARGLSSEKKFVSVLDSSAVMADYSDISSSRGLPLIVIDDSASQTQNPLLNFFLKRKLKSTINRNFHHIENYLLAPPKSFEDIREYQLSKNTLAPLAEKQIENVVVAIKRKDGNSNPIRLEFADSYFNIPLHPRIDSLKNLPLLYFQLFSIETLKASALKRDLARKHL